MPSYLVETFLARGDGAVVTARERLARSAAEKLTQAGTDVRFKGAIHVPSDEMCFFVFDAPSSRYAAIAAQRAGLDPFRVVEAVPSANEKEEQ